MPSLASVFLHTVDGIFAVDPWQRIVYWNAGCELMFGISSAQAVGKRCSEVVRGKSPLQLAGYDLSKMPMNWLCRGYCFETATTREVEHVPNR